MKNSEINQSAKIEIAIAKRINKHENDHRGLYSQTDLETLRPIWKRQIMNDVNSSIGKTILVY